MRGLVSIQFLCVLGKFFEVDLSILKQTITELYMNLSYETLSKARDVNFDAVADLTAKLYFAIKKGMLENINRQEEEHQQTIDQINDSRGFTDKTKDEKFKKELEDYLKTDLEHKK